MFRIIFAVLVISIAITSAFSLKKLLHLSSVKDIQSSSSKLLAIWDLNLQRLGKGYRNLQGDDSEVPVVPTVGEEITSKGARKAFLKGPGVDERTCTVGNGPFSEDDLDSLPRLYKFHRQLTLLSALQGDQFGGLQKIERLKMANLEGILPHDTTSNTPRAATVRSAKLLDDWNFDMNA